MSTTTPTSKKEFLAHIPDHPNALQKRLAARPEHLAAAVPSLGKTMLFGGATLERHPEEGEEGPPPMNGSVALFVAESEEEVRRMIAQDPYTRNGVWDAEKVTIWPFRTALAVAKN